MSNLTQAQRDQMQKDLLKLQDEINSKLRALGVTKPRSKYDKAGDGGPMSSAHAYLMPQLRQTYDVIWKREDGTEVEAVVPVDKFDSATMTRVDEVGRKPRVVAAPPVPPAPSSSSYSSSSSKKSAKPTKPAKPINVSNYSKEDMLVMSTAQLRSLPEVVDHIDEIPDKKQDLVDAILAVREMAGK